MRLLAGSIGIFALSMTLGGCATPQSKVHSPSSTAVAVHGGGDGNEALAGLNEQLNAHDGNNVFDTLNDELSRTIGTTSLTSEVILVSMPLPESRMSISEAEAVPPPAVTWGTPTAPLDLSDIPDSRE